METNTEFKAPRFPKKELKNWVRENQIWNHEDWNNLLWRLREEGFALYTDSEVGQQMLGSYLESEKQKIQ